MFLAFIKPNFLLSFYVSLFILFPSLLYKVINETCVPLYPPRKILFYLFNFFLSFFLTWLTVCFIHLSWSQIIFFSFNLSSFRVGFLLFFHFSFQLALFLKCIISFIIYFFFHSFVRPPYFYFFYILVFVFFFFLSS